MKFMRYLVHGEVFRIMRNHHLFHRIVIAVLEIHPLRRQVIEVGKLFLHATLADEKVKDSPQCRALNKLPVEPRLDHRFQPYASRILQIHAILIDIGCRAKNKERDLCKDVLDNLDVHHAFRLAVPAEDVETVKPRFFFRLLLKAVDEVFQKAP